MRWTVAAMMVACGDAGQSGAEGATGPTGPVGAPGGNFRWHDANGEQVTIGADLSFFDDNGWLWGIDQETGAARATGTGLLYFSEPDCTGDAYVAQPSAPRVVLSGLLWGEPEALYVRPDGLAVAEQVLPSGSLGVGLCGNGGDLVNAAPLAGLVDVGAPPATPWTGPLHPEPVE